MHAILQCSKYKIVLQSGCFQAVYVEAKLVFQTHICPDFQQAAFETNCVLKLKQISEILFYSELRLRPGSSAYAVFVVATLWT